MFRLLPSLFALACLMTVQPRSLLAQTGDRSPGASPAVLVNINTASVADFEALPGVGAKTAARIVEYRQKNGPFKKVEELMNVRGVGEKSFLKLKPQLTVGAPKADQHATQER